MAQVSVNIGGRSYRLACNPGEEPHLQNLAASLDRKILEMRGSFGEIGDQRLAIMAALTVADEAAEAGRRADLETARADAAEADAREARQDEERATQALNRTLNEMSAKIEALTEALAGGRAKG